MRYQPKNCAAFVTCAVKPPFFNKLLARTPSWVWFLHLGFLRSTDICVLRLSLFGFVIRVSRPCPDLGAADPLKLFDLALNLLELRVELGVGAVHVLDLLLHRRCHALRPLHCALRLQPRFQSSILRLDDLPPQAHDLPTPAVRLQVVAARRVDDRHVPRTC
eukprot:927677-Rhodomonas_salina.10